MLGVDGCGLDEMDRSVLLSIIEHYGGGPVGLNTIAVVVGEEPDTIEEVYEPFLIQSGFQENPREGVTMKTYKYFGLRPPSYLDNQQDLFQKLTPDHLAKTESYIFSGSKSSWLQHLFFLIKNVRRK